MRTSLQTLPNPHHILHIRKVCKHCNNRTLLMATFAGKSMCDFAFSSCRVKLILVPRDETNACTSPRVLHREDTPDARACAKDEDVFVSRGNLSRAKVSRAAETADEEEC